MMRVISLFLRTTLFCACFDTALFAQNPGQTASLDTASARQLIAESMTLYDSGKFELSIERAERAYRFFHNTAGSNPSDLADAAYQSGAKRLVLLFAAQSIFFGNGAEMGRILCAQFVHHRIADFLCVDI